MLVPDPYTKVLWGRTTSGKAAYMGRRTAEHVNYTIAALAKAYPKATFHVIQSAYNTGVAASAGTHDKDCCLDVYIDGLGWWEAQHFLRQLGWGAFYRYPPKFGRHIHMISLNYGRAPVGIYVPGQVRDYLGHPPRDGLAGHRVDPTWHPGNIPATFFDYDKWMNDKESYMTNLEDQLITMLVGPNDEPKKVPLKSVLQDLEGTQDRDRAHADERANDILEAISLVAKKLTTLNELLREQLGQPSPKEKQ